jgi:hypothetical protein
MCIACYRRRLSSPQHSLAPSDALTVDSNWPNRHLGSLDILTACIRNSPSVGVWQDGELVSWGLVRGKHTVDVRCLLSLAQNTAQLVASTLYLRVGVAVSPLRCFSIWSLRSMLLIAWHSRTSHRAIWRPSMRLSVVECDPVLASHGSLVQPRNAAQQRLPRHY